MASTARRACQPWAVDRFETRRKAAGLSIKIVAVRAGLDEATLRRLIKTGRAKAATAQRLEMALGALIRAGGNIHILEHVL